uniref:Protein ST7 homolog n=1 Tax=Timema californicum TaxID=61474 RepID=A0A7R9JAI3_TIMCA|nr:unnamed protein product [Timema californicum]
MFLSTLTPKFYVALTGTSSLISGLILIFEWWYFRKYGTSFIEQVSLNHISPWIGGGETNSEASNPTSTSTATTSQQTVPECKVWRNPLNLLRGAEYQRFYWATNKEPLTYYDMNLSAQDHQTFFTCEGDCGRSEYEVMQTAWRERNPVARIKAANDALEKNPECAPAYILLAEEEATTILEAEKILKQALKVAESNYRKSQQTQHQGTVMEAIHIHPTEIRTSISPSSVVELNTTSVLASYATEAEMQAYADVQAVLAKYDDISLPKSATICYTAALLKARLVADKFSPDIASKRGLTTAEMTAVEAIHRAVEFNPHVPKYLLEMKPLILPPEHVLKRGDSEAVAYAFFHLPHWKQVEGALNLLHCTWEGTFRLLPYPLERGHLFYPYPTCTECADRELLPRREAITITSVSVIRFALEVNKKFIHVRHWLLILGPQVQFPTGTMGIFLEGEQPQWSLVSDAQLDVPTIPLSD